MIALSAGAWDEGVEAVRRGDWFAAHEAFEAVWRADHGAERAFVQGLIQACVALHHLERGNAVGFERQRARALDKLRRFDAGARGVDNAALQAILAGLAPGGAIDVARVAAVFPA